MDHTRWRSIGSNRFAFVYTPGSATSTGAQLATLTGDQFDGGAVSLFGAEATDSAAISTTDTVRGMLGHLTSGQEKLTIGQPDADAGGDMQYDLAAEPWGAVAAIGSHVATLLPLAQGLAFGLYDSSSSKVMSSGTFKGPTFSSGDIAALGNRLIAVGANDIGLSAYRIDGALDTPTHSEQALQHFTGNVGGQPLPVVQSLAIAAARSTVAVVYAGKGTPGYWALLSCAN